MADREEGVPAPNQWWQWQQNQQQQNQQEQQQIQDPAGPQQQHLHLNWSNFKPEFLGKPDEDAEAHLLCSNDWMNAHHFVDGVKVQRFCVTLLGEARTMVPLPRTHKCRLAWTAKLVQTQIFKGRQHARTIISHTEVFQFW